VHKGWGGKAKTSGRERRVRASEDTMGTHINKVPLLSTLISSSWKAFMQYTRDLMLSGVASAYCSIFFESRVFIEN